MPKITKEMQELFGYTDDQVKDLKENQIQLIDKRWCKINCVN